MTILTVVIAGTHGGSLTYRINNGGFGSSHVSDADIEAALNNLKKSPKMQQVVDEALGHSGGDHVVDVNTYDSAYTANTNRTEYQQNPGREGRDGSISINGEQLATTRYETTESTSVPPTLERVLAHETRHWGQQMELGDEAFADPPYDLEPDAAEVARDVVDFDDEPDFTGNELIHQAEIDPEIGHTPYEWDVQAIRQIEDILGSSHFWSDFLSDGRSDGPADGAGGGGGGGGGTEGGSCPYIPPPENRPERRGSPLVLDLDGDGVELYAKGDYGTYFDLRGTGQAVLTGWVEPDDGLLAIDLNHDGGINDISELFGNLTTDGFTSLRTLDSNSDGVINSSDADFGDLLVWTDTNSDGFSQSSELHTLTDLSITAISLQAERVHDEVEGNSITHVSSFTIGGVDQDIVDAWFDYDTVMTRNSASYDLDLRTAELPTLRGYGDLKDLYIAASLDNGDDPETMIEQLIAFASARTHIDASLSNWDTVISDVDAIMLTWAGATGISTTSRGIYVNAQHLAFYEAFTGYPFLQSGHSNPLIEAGTNIEAIYENIRTVFAVQLIAQTAGAEIFEDANYDLYTGGISGDLDLVQGGIDAIQAAAVLAVDPASVWATFAQFIGYTKGLDNLTVGEIAALDTAVAATADPAVSNWQDAVSLMTASLGAIIDSPDDWGSYEILYNNTITGTSGNDNLVDDNAGGVHDTLFFGGNGNDTIDGGDGDDKIVGQSGNDILIGGTGNDYLIGGLNDDTYRYTSGNDTISEVNGSGYDEIHVLSSTNLTTSNIVDIYRYQNDLLILLSTGAYITIHEQATAPVEIIVFDKNSSSVVLGDVGKFYGTEDMDEMSVTGISSQTLVVYGYGGNDTLEVTGAKGQLHGGDGYDSIIGGAYVDNLYGDNQDDYILGNAGADVIQGGAGNDYIDGGDDNDDITGNVGSDTIYGGGGNDYIHQSSTTGTSTDVDYVYGGAGDDTISLADGADHVYGGDGADIITTSSGADYVDGGDGDDIIDAGTYDDIVYGGAGNDTIELSSGNNEAHGGDGNDTITVSQNSSTDDDTNYIYGDGGDDIITTADGDDYIWGGDGADTIDTDTGADTVYGGDGDDYINSYWGADYVDAGDGNNIVYGGYENDTIVAGSGDDYLNGGGDNDSLSGGAGSDTYFYESDSAGLDVITDASGSMDVLSFGGTRRPEHMTFSTVSTYNVVMTFDSINKVTVVGQLDTGGTTQIEKLQFDDGFWLDFSTVGSWTWGTSSGQTIAGTSGVDTILGRGGNDTINGSGGADHLSGDGGNDTLNGGSGDDYLHGGSGTDTLNGDDDNDYLFAGSGDDVLNGGNGDDFLDGGSGDDQFHGDAGTDTVTHNDVSADFIIYRNNAGYLTMVDTAAGFGTDRIYADVEQVKFNDLTLDLTTMTFLLNGEGWGTAARVDGTGSANTLTGTVAADNIHGAGGADTINGGLGNDSLYGDAGNDHIEGGADNDTLDGGAGNDSFDGGNGTDAVTYAGSAAGVTVDLFAGTASGYGSDTLTAVENITGSNYDDTFVASSVANTLAGGSGNDTVSYANATALVTANLGTGAVTGGSGTDTLSSIENLVGSAYNDNLAGSTAANTLSGLAGNDTLTGGDGNDVLYGGDGLDTLWGGTGADKFVFEAATAFNNVDVVQDFSVGDNDKLDISDIIDFDSGTDVITDFVQIITNGSNSEVRVDVSGTANFAAGTYIASLVGVTGLTDEDALLTSGHLIAA